MTSTGGVPYVRVTLLGARRNGDLALPTDVPVATVLPSVLDLLDEAAPAQRRELVTVTGTVLNPALPLAEQDVADGAILRLVSTSETPPEPIVYDMVDIAEDARPVGMWGNGSRPWVLAGLALASIAAAAVLWPQAKNTEPRLVWACIAAATLVASAIFGAVRAVPASWTFATGGVLAGAMALWSERSSAPYWHVVTLGVVAVLAFGWCARQPVMAGLAGATLISSAALVALTKALNDDAAHAAATVSVILVLLCGLMPRAALTASGAFRADATVTSGLELRRFDAVARIGRAHWALAGALVALASILAWNLYLLAHASKLEAWPTALTIVLVTAVALRARHFPLALERAALWGAAGLGLFGLGEAALTRTGVAWVVPAAFVALAGVILACSALRPTPLHVAQARRLAQALESTAIITTIPLLLGVFGVYSQLLDSFR